MKVTDADHNERLTSIASAATDAVDDLFFFLFPATAAAATTATALEGTCPAPVSEGLGRMGPVEALGPLAAAAAAAATALLVLLTFLTLEEEGGGGEDGEVITFEDEAEDEGEVAAAVSFRPWPCHPPPTGPLSLRRPLTEVGFGFSGLASFSRAGEEGGGGGHLLRPLPAAEGASKPMPLLLALLRARSVEPSLSNRCTIDATDNWTEMWRMGSRQV